MNCKKTKTGDLVQVHECKQKDVTYGLIAIRLKKAHSQLSEAETVVVEFMRQLQPIFAIQHTAGVAIDYSSPKHMLSVADYWQDADGTDWKVKGWADRKTIAVLYIKNISCLPVGREEMFLNGSLFVTR